ncbi:MAG TPA: hypothetical protein VFH51_05780, partial [Myxococcota bacterium]|nr:hypothetical protein [Myxococcota bacterium]
MVGCALARLLAPAPRRALLALALLAAACGRSDPGISATVGQGLEQASFTNGDFETGSVGVAPSGWTVTTYKNGGVAGTSTAPPTAITALNLGTAGAGAAQTLVVGATSLQYPYDPDLPASQLFQYPLYGSQATRVNYGGPASNGNNRNVNVLSQTMTIAAADVDPLDGLAHVRFAIAPVLENPSHSFNQQPYFFVQLDNLTTGVRAFNGFNTAGQTGVPWNTTTGSRSGNVTQWLNWQLVDISSSTGLVKIGDSVKLSVVASGCSLGGHFGRVYVDGTGATVPGIYTWAAAPTSVAAGSTLTYTINYANGSTTSAIGTSLTFTTPPNTTYASTTGSACSGATAGQAGTLTCTLGTLSAGATGSFTITVNVVSGTTGSLTAGNYFISAVNQRTLLGAPVTTSIISGTQGDLNVNWSGTPLTTGNWNTTNPNYSIVVNNPSSNAIATGKLRLSYPKPSKFASWTWTCTGAENQSACNPASGTGDINTTAKLWKNGGALTFLISGSRIIVGSGVSSTSSTFTATPDSSFKDP